MSTISVVIPCYNYGLFLEEAVKSALLQTKRPDMIIIMDDHSTDTLTERIAGSLAKENQNIVYFRNPSNFGIIRNRHEGVCKCNTDYIVCLDADDRLRTTYLEKTSKVLDENDKVGIVYTQVAMFGDLKDKTYVTEWWHGNKEPDFYLWEYPPFNVNTKARIAQNNFIHCSAMFRKKAFDQVGGFIESSKKAKPEDYALWRAMICDAGWDAYLVEEYLLEYRQHSPKQRNRS